jgi:hypothetical protein
MGVRTVQRSHASPLLFLQHAMALASQHEHSGELCLGYTLFIQYLSPIVPGLYHVYFILIPSYPSYPCLQDTVLTVPPYPFVLEDPSEVPLKERWVASPKLFFTCHLRPTDGRQPRARHTC